jgi:TRAP-type C4-dicarboxylate transport system permease small subunit
MKKILLLAFLSAIFLTSAVFSVKAATSTCASTGTYTFEGCSGVNDLGEKAGYTVGTQLAPEFYIGLVLKIIFSVLGLVFLILTIYAGIKWMTAQGNTSQIDQAKDTITRAIIGLVICMVSYGLTFFILNIFQGKNTVNVDSNIQTVPDYNANPKPTTGLIKSTC